MPKVTRGTLAVACVLFGAGLGFFLGRWSASEERLPINGSMHEIAIGVLIGIAANFATLALTSIYASHRRSRSDPRKWTWFENVADGATERGGKSLILVFFEATKTGSLWPRGMATVSFSLGTTIAALGLLNDISSWLRPVAIGPVSSLALLLIVAKTVSEVPLILVATVRARLYSRAGIWLSLKPVFYLLPIVGFPADAFVSWFVLRGILAITKRQSVDLSADRSLDAPLENGLDGSEALHLYGTPTDGGAIKVHAAATGKRYHNQHCRYARSATTSVSIADARGRGLTACRVCQPPQ